MTSLAGPSLVPRPETTRGQTLTSLPGVGLAPRDYIMTRQNRLVRVVLLSILVLTVFTVTLMLKVDFIHKPSGPSDSKYTMRGGSTDSKHTMGGGSSHSKHTMGGGSSHSKHTMGGDSSHSKHTMGGGLSDSKHTMGGEPSDSKHTMGAGRSDSNRTMEAGPGDSNRTMEGDAKQAQPRFVYTNRKLSANSSQESTRQS